MTSKKGAGVELVPANNSSIKNATGVIVDAKTKRWLPGSSGNPTGRPVKKRDAMDKMMQTFWGPDCIHLLESMIEIASYEHNVKIDGKLPKWTSQQVIDARKFLYEQFYGKSMQETKTEISTPEDRAIKVIFARGVDE